MSKLSLSKEEATKEIKAVKQTNKVARERRAELKGFASSVLYLVALQAIVDGKVEETTSSKPAKKVKKASKSGVKPVIFIIDVLDRSGSMGTLYSKGSKISAAVAGINTSVDNLRAEEAQLGVEYKHVFVYFDNDYTISEARPIADVPHLSIDGRGGTALSDTIIASIDRALTLKRKEDKVLINIYTDGDENCSRASYTQAKNRISASEKDGIVVTFIGTKYDTSRAISNYGLHQSNTMVYDGTAQGMSMSMQETSSARSVFSKKVVAGESVTKGFYKKIVK